MPKPLHRAGHDDPLNESLNESPSEKEGKCPNGARASPIFARPSMKVPPKRKGNLLFG